MEGERKHWARVGEVAEGSYQGSGCHWSLLGAWARRYRCTCTFHRNSGGWELYPFSAMHARHAMPSQRLQLF